MTSQPKNAVILLIAILLTAIITPIALSENYGRTYNCNAQFGLNNHEINISVPQSLYDYYQTKTHSLRNESDYQNFVTPQVMTAIAENIRNMTSTSEYSDEEFANAVLTLVHEIPYVPSDVKYPVETIVENQGDCDTVSVLAASILKSGGLDVVLFYYPKAAHMNIGIHLPNKPYSTWMTPPKSYEYNGVEYWMAECTPKAEWQVGDQPESLAGETPMIIPLENCEKTAPAQIASTMDTPLTASNITINLSSPPFFTYTEEQNLTVSGTITPAIPDANVVMYTSQNTTTWDTYTTKTDYSGHYLFPWDFTKTGTYYIKTSWSGADNFAGADSETLTVFIGFPKTLVQFQTDTYIYIMGNPGVANQELRVRQGVENFLNLNLTGAGITLTSEFIVVKSGETISSVREPEYGIGTQPLRLPDNLLKNDQFCFILQRNQSNYNVDVKALDKNAVSHMQQLQGNRTAFLDASGKVQENTWYTLTAALSENKITAELRDMNGNLLERMTTTSKATNIDEIGILMANNTDRAVAFKNLKVTTQNQPIQPLDGNANPPNEYEVVMPYINWAIVLTSVLAATVYIAKRRKRQTSPESQSATQISQTNDSFRNCT
jgi:hypothetical protein